MKAYDYPTAFSWWSDEEREAIARVIASGRFTQGPEVEAFEEEFARFHGRKHAIMVNSGSSANLLAVSALIESERIERGQVAIVPALAWSTTYAPLRQYMIDLVLADCDETWNAQPPPAFWDRRVKLVIGCSILGNPAHLDKWLSWCTHGLSATAWPSDISFVEDNCESLGASYRGQFCGTFGLLSTFSLFYSHQISAIEGGVILTDNDELARLCRVLRAHGWTRDVAAPQLFETEYCFTHFGYNVRGLELHAAIARAQLRKLPGMIERRRKNWYFFRTLVEASAAGPLPITLPRENGLMSPFGLQFEVKDRTTRRGLAVELRKAGIDCRLPTGGSFRLHPYGQPWAYQKTPKADRIHDCGMFIGNAPWDISDKIERAVKVMREVL